MQSQAPVVLTGNPQIVKLPSVLPGATQLRISNESAFALQIGLSGDTHWLNPWTTDVYTPPQMITQIAVTPFVLTPSAVNPPSSILLLSIADPGEKIPGTYPMTLDRQSVSYAPRKLLTTITTINGMVTTTVNPPYGALALRFFFSAPNTSSVCVVTGTTTGAAYAPGNNFVPSNSVNPFTVSIETTIDASYQIQLTSSVAGAFLWVLALTDVELMTGLGSAAAYEMKITDPSDAYFAGFDINGAVNSLNVSHHSATPAPWQVPTATATANTVLNGSTTQTLITGVGGQRIYVHQIHLIFSAAPPNPITLKESGGLSFRVVAPGAGVPQGPYVWDLKGMAMPLGNSFQISNGSATNVGLQCQVDYAQV